MCNKYISLQLLLHTTPFVKFLLRSNWEKSINPSNDPYTRILTLLSIKYWAVPSNDESNQPL